jgi:hypothetical protein
MIYIQEISHLIKRIALMSRALAIAVLMEFIIVRVLRIHIRLTGPGDAN